MAGRHGRRPAVVPGNHELLPASADIECGPARDFLKGFDDAIVALGQPEAANYVNGTYDLKAQTVLGVVTQMTDAGLRFAPANPGDEAAYERLREALAACDRAVAKPQTAMR